MYMFVQNITKLGVAVVHELSCQQTFCLSRNGEKPVLWPWPLTYQPLTFQVNLKFSAFRAVVKVNVHAKFLRAKKCGGHAMSYL